MGWSYRLARISGIDIKIHFSFLFIVVFFALQWSLVHGLPGALFGTVLILALFFCVTLHELGHSLAAQRLGVPVREIILLPLGGVALLGRNPKQPLHELIIAVSGPAVNVALALLLFLVLAITGDLGLLDGMAMLRGTQTSLSVGTLLTWLLEANILLVLFNMIPAFPLDGGRMLRAVLAMYIGTRRATSVASAVGRAFAVFLGILGLLSLDVIMILIAVFIFLGASQEYAQERANTVLSTQRVGDAYNKYVLTLSVGDRVHRVIDYILTSYQPDFAVLQGGRLLGIITRDDLLRALASGSQDTYVPDIYVTMVMQRDVVKVDADTTLDDVRQVMNDNRVRVVAVYEGETYLGLINMEDIAEAFTVLSFLERHRKQQPPQQGEQDTTQPGAGSPPVDTS